MEETGILENPISVNRLLPDFEPGRKAVAQTRTVRADAKPGSAGNQDTSTASSRRRSSGSSARMRATISALKTFSEADLFD
jgi:hypothetical protein